MQLTGNASINLVPLSGDWSDVSGSRVKGREQGSSQQQHRMRESQKGEEDRKKKKGGKITAQSNSKLIICSAIIFLTTPHFLQQSVSYSVKKVSMSMRSSGMLLRKETSRTHLIGSDQLLHAVFEHSITAQSIVGLG